MNFNVRLKTLQLERLESRELMASYVSSWQPPEGEAAGFYVRAAISSMATSNAKGDHPPSQEVFRSQQKDIGSLTESPLSRRSINDDFPRVIQVGSILVPQHTRQVFLLVEVRTSVDNTPVVIHQPIVEPFVASGHFQREADSFLPGQESTAEGEANEMDRPNQTREVGATQTVSFARNRLGDADKETTLAPGNLQTLPGAEAETAEAESRLNSPFASKYTDFGLNFIDKRAGDIFFLDIGTEGLRYNRGAAVDGILAKLFAQPIDDRDDASGDGFSRNSERDNQVELNWQYSLPTMLLKGGTECKSEAVAAASIFGIYDVSSKAFSGNEFSPHEPDTSHVWTAGNDAPCAEPSIDSSMMDHRYWTIGIVIASVWFSVRNRRRWSGGVGRWLKRSHLSRYFKKASDRG